VASKQNIIDYTSATNISMDTDRNILDSPTLKMAAILSVYSYVMIIEILTKYYRLLQLKWTKLMRHGARKRKERKANRFLVGKREVKRLLGKCTCSWCVMKLVFNTFRTGSFKLFKRLFPGFLK